MQYQFSTFMKFQQIRQVVFDIYDLREILSFLLSVRPVEYFFINDNPTGGISSSVEEWINDSYI